MLLLGAKEILYKLLIFISISNYSQKFEIFHHYAVNFYFKNFSEKELKPFWQRKIDEILNDRNALIKRVMLALEGGFLGQIAIGEFEGVGRHQGGKKNKKRKKPFCLAAGGKGRKKNQILANSLPPDC